MRNSFVFYRSFYEALAELPADQCKEVLVALCRYAMDDEKPEGLNAISNAIFSLIKPQIDANNKRRENGRKGGEANASKIKAIQSKHEANMKQTQASPEESEANVNVNVNVNDKYKRKETNKEKKSVQSSDCTSEFNTLWLKYPRKQGKPNALSAYIKARKSGVTFEEVSAGLDRYNNYIRAENIEQRYIKMGSTWFNGQCWNDDYVSKANITTADIAPLMTYEEFMV